MGGRFGPRLAPPSACGTLVGLFQRLTHSRYHARTPSIQPIQRLELFPRRSLVERFPACFKAPDMLGTGQDQLLELTFGQNPYRGISR